ncbi:HAMP domain-containing sensor histidine kinase, partial [Halorubrum sp. AJ67]|uniref:sensor histidine kinase n=1 Tax=Halorubrum sp. AJ67 TaxID=1173487 RepID=UPI00064F626B
GEKAGTVEQLLADSDPERTDVRDLLRSVVADARERDGDATVELDVDGAEREVDEAGWTTNVRPDALRAVVENTVENAVDHHDGEGTEREDGGTWVRASLRREARASGDDDARFVLTVEDDGPGIPDHEVEAVESGRETALEHGSGLGLWVVAWGAAAIGADVAYADWEPRGTRVRVSIPVVVAE